MQSKHSSFSIIKLKKIGRIHSTMLSICQSQRRSTQLRFTVRSTIPHHCGSSNNTSFISSICSRMIIISFIHDYLMMITDDLSLQTNERKNYLLIITRFILPTENYSIAHKFFASACI